MKKITKIIILSITIIGIFGLYNLDIHKKNPKEQPRPESKTDNITKTKIIATGDSLTAGYGLPLEDSYPAQLEKKIINAGYDVEIINAGISGETTAGLLERIEFIKKQNPQIVLITIGGNDALRNLPIDTTEQNIKTIIKKLKQTIPSQKIFLMQINSPLNAGIAYTNKFNQIYPKISKEEEVVLIPFVEKEVFSNQNLIQEDGIHPNKEGYTFLIDKYIYKKVVKELSP